MVAGGSASVVIKGGSQYRNDIGAVELSVDVLEGVLEWVGVREQDPVNAPFQQIH